MVEISTSVLTVKKEEILGAIYNLEMAKTDYFHIDVMDGKFVENKTWTYSEVKKIISYSKLPLDVHLMVKNPEKYIEDYALLNTSYLTFHYEAVKDVQNIIDTIKNYGLKVGISICPDTEVKKVVPTFKDPKEVNKNI